MGVYRTYIEQVSFTTCELALKNFVVKFSLSYSYPILKQDFILLEKHNAFVSGERKHNLALFINCVVTEDFRKHIGVFEYEVFHIVTFKVTSFILQNVSKVLWLCVPKMLLFFCFFFYKEPPIVQVKDRDM